MLGTLPAPPAAGGDAGVLHLADGVLVHRPAPDGATVGAALAAGVLEDRLAAAVASHGLLPADFALDFAGDREEEGPLVRDATSLPGSELSFVLRHADPEAFVSGEKKRLLVLRGALVLLALLTAAAAFATARVLRRERDLARLRTSFVANVSHELRTPLSAILLMAENLERGLVREEAARGRYHGLIRREAQRLRRLVDDVLDFARLERGEGPALSPVAVEVAAFARELERDLRERAAGAGPELAFRLADPPATARFDPEAIRRAVLNLADNALRHAGAKRIAVEIAGDGRGGLRLAVRDDGVGIAPARRAAIFAPFARGAPPGRGAPGAGLGLAIVRGIAAAHGGSALCLDPGPGGGALFAIELPAAPVRMGEGDGKMEEA
ncbi:MAG: HAMP domain-containing sensor histidine kinase [Planctomycetota bacterium]